MVGKIFVVLRGDLSDLSEIPPGAGWKIVVFQVVAQVDVWDVPPADIVIGFLALDEFVMFCDDMNSCWVGAD